MSAPRWLIDKIRDAVIDEAESIANDIASELVATGDASYDVTLTVEIDVSVGH